MFFDYKNIRLKSNRNTGTVQLKIFAKPQKRGVESGTDRIDKTF